MILLLDAGNSRIKWGLRENGDWVLRGVSPTPELVRLDADLSKYPCVRALVCCVADDTTRSSLRSLLSPRVDELVWLTAQADAHGVLNRYHPPASLGADRYAALVAARRRALGDCLVVNVGTALTVDALTAQGEFLGGVIAPGPDLMQSALARGTAGVRDFTGAPAMFPANTGSAVEAGIALALIGVVLGMRERLARHAGAGVTILLSGGARRRLSGAFTPPVLEVDDLVLEGLFWIAKEERWDV